MRRSVCIVLPRQGIYPALGRMLLDTFASLGWEATIEDRPRDAVPDRGLLLLLGSGGLRPALIERLRRRPGNRPVTALWQVEPLPPVSLSARGESIGLRVAAWDWGRLSPGARRVLACVVPFRPALLRLVRRWLARPYTRQVVRQPAHEGWQQFDVNLYFNTMAEWRRLRAAHAAGGVDHWFATSQPRVEFLRRRGIAAHLLPFGYHPDWGRDLQLARDVDVLYLGPGDRGRRREVLAEVRVRLAHRGRAVTHVREAFGHEREQWLNRARIFLNLLRVPYDLAGLRVMLGMACGALVVSEQCPGTGAFRPGEHLIMAPRAALPEMLLHYLEHEEQRRQIAARGHRFVTEELTLPKVVRKMLAQITNGHSI